MRLLTLFMELAFVADADVSGLESALRCGNQAVALAKTQLSVGRAAEHLQSLLREGAECYKTALTISPTDAQAIYGQSQISLLQSTAVASDKLVREVSPEVAAALRVLAAELQRLQPSRMLGTTAEVVDARLQAETGLSKVESGLWSMLRNQAVDQGGLQSFAADMPLSGHGKPLPSYTYPAVEWLDQHDLTNLSVLEFGSGHSTLYFASRAKQVVALENNDQWVERVREAVTAMGVQNVDVIRASLGKKPTEWRDSRDGSAGWVGNMAEALDASQWANSTFDIVVVDGMGNRQVMALEAARRLSPSGIVILDNSEWYPRTAELLRDAHRMMQVDFHGLKPAERHAATTSVFFNLAKQFSKEEDPGGYADPWSRGLRQRLDRMMWSGKLEWSWKAAPTSLLSGLPGGYPVGGQVAGVASGWDLTPAEVEAGRGLLIAPECHFATSFEKCFWSPQRVRDHRDR